MFYDNRLSVLKESLRASEELSKISSMNLANANTIGYKKLVGYIAPDCGNCDDSFEGVMDSLHSPVKLNIEKDTKSPAGEVLINGKTYEGSNVDPTEELQNMVEAANMTRSILTSIQIDNRLEQEILNLRLR